MISGWFITHVVLEVWLATVEQENTTCFIMTILAAEVKWSKSAAVFDVKIGFCLAEN